MDVAVLLKGVAPSIVAALLLVSWLGARALPLAMGLGLFVAHGLLKHWPAWPHELWMDPTATDWMVWCLMLAGVLALLEHVKAWPARAAVATGVVVAAFSVVLMLQKVKHAQKWDDGDVSLFVGGGGVAAAMIAWSQRAVLSRAPASIWPAVLWALILSLDAAIVVNGKSAFLAQLCGAVAAAVGAAAGTSLWRPGFALRAADGLWLGLAHALFLLSAVHLADSTWPPVLLALAAPVLLLLLPRGFAKEQPARWFACALPMVLVPLLIAFWFWQPEANPYGY